MEKFQTPVLNDENALKLGIFAINLRGGVTLADVEGNVQGTRDENVRLARRADGLGLDAVVPIARWRGYGGTANLGDRSFETFTRATGLMAATERIRAFATTHVPLAHPIMVAKMAATDDHISAGASGSTSSPAGTPRTPRCSASASASTTSATPSPTSGRGCSGSSGPRRARSTSTAATSTCPTTRCGPRSGRQRTGAAVLVDVRVGASVPAG